MERPWDMHVITFFLMQGEYTEDVQTIRARALEEGRSDVVAACDSITERSSAELVTGIMLQDMMNQFLAKGSS